MREMLSIPALVHYFYFLSSEEEVIKRAWNDIVSAYDLKEDAAEKREQFIKETSASSLSSLYAAQMLKSFSSRDVRSFLFLFKDIAIIELLFFLPWKEQLQKINDKREGMKDIISSALGEATVIVVDDASEEVLGSVKDVFSPDFIAQTEFASCTLFHFVTPNRERHFYACKPSNSEAAARFLTRELPVIDVSVQKLQKEAAYFQKQREWIGGEREKIDKSIGKILHRQVVGTKAEKEKADVLESDISELSMMYGLLATDAVMLKNAHTALTAHAEDLKEFIKTLLVPSESNGIEQLHLKTTRQLTERLAAEEGYVRNSIKTAKTAIDVVKSKIELVRSKEGLALQEESIALQVAASFIEFIILFYYALSAWEHLISLEKFEHIPIFYRFISVLLFSVSVVAYTHFVAKSYKTGWKFNKRLLLSLIGIFTTLGAMVVLSL